MNPGEPWAGAARDRLREIAQLVRRRAHQGSSWNLAQHAEQPGLRPHSARTKALAQRLRRSGLRLATEPSRGSR